MKFADYQGERALDLTMGLGVDTWELSKKYKQVVALEVDPVLCEIARHNFKRLGVDNVEIIEAEATQWLQSYKGEGFDLIYLDPSRREEKGKRTFQLHESSPNPLFLADQMLSLGKKVLLKGSPMLTLDENRLVLPCVETLTIQSVEGECKETLFEMKDPFLGHPYWKARFCRDGEIYSYETNHRELAKPLEILDPGHYIYEPDVALYKASLVVSYMEDKFPHLSGGFTDGPGYYVSPELDESFPGNIWKFTETISFKPKVLKKEGRKTHRIQLGKKGVALYLDQIRQDYNLKMGGNNYWLFAKWLDKKVVMVGERVK